MPRESVIIIDAPYFRRGFGVMVFRDAYQKNNLFWNYVIYETIQHYKEGINLLKIRGWKIKAIVCDGRRGLFTAFPGCPVQMCHFHLQMIVRRYLTGNPRDIAKIELRNLCFTLTDIDKESWVFALTSWHEIWKDYLREKTINPNTGKRHYTHKRLRSAYRSLKSNTNYFLPSKIILNCISQKQQTHWMDSLLI